MEIVPPERMPGEHALEGAAQYHAALDELLAQAQHDVRIFRMAPRPQLQHPATLRPAGQAPARRAQQPGLHDPARCLERRTRLPPPCRRAAALQRRPEQRKVLPPARHVQDPFAIADEHRFVHRFHHESMRGVASIGDIARTQPMLRRF